MAAASELDGNATLLLALKVAVCAGADRISGLCQDSSCNTAASEARIAAAELNK